MMDWTAGEDKRMEAWRGESVDDPRPEPEEPDDTRRLVTMRVKDITIVAPGSVHRPCAECGEPCWASPASLKQAGESALITCFHCAAAIFEMAEPGEVKFEPVTREQVEEVRAEVRHQIAAEVARQLDDLFRP